MSETVEWGGLRKLVTNNTGSRLLHGKSPREGKLVHRTAILADITFQGQVSFDYLKRWNAGGDPVYDTYRFTPAPYHQPVWLNYEYEGDTIYYTYADIPAWCRFDGPDRRSEGPVTWSWGIIPTHDAYFMYDYFYTICCQSGYGDKTPEDNRFFFAVNVTPTQGDIFIRNKTDPENPINLSQAGGFSFCWTAPINTTLAKPFPNWETIWHPDNMLDDTYLNPYSARGIWPVIYYSGYSKAGAYCHLNTVNMAIDTSVVPLVQFHGEEPTDPANP